jgi:hypothetical protein
MKLNRTAAEIFVRETICGCTDVTGFALLGHASEMAEKSGVSIRISASAVPFLPGHRRSRLGTGPRSNSLRPCQQTVRLSPSRLTIPSSSILFRRGIMYRRDNPVLSFASGMEKDDPEGSPSRIRSASALKFSAL